MNWQNILPIVLPHIKVCHLVKLGPEGLGEEPFQVISAEDLLLLINNRKLNGKVVVKTDSELLDEQLEHDPLFDHCDRYKRIDMLSDDFNFLVLDEDFAFKILTLGFLPEVNS